MTSPDHAAAALAEDETRPTWKGEPLPQVGREVAVTTLHTTGSRSRVATFTGTVSLTPEIDGEGTLHLSVTVPPTREVIDLRLRSNSLTSKWSYRDQAAPRLKDVSRSAAAPDDEPTPFDQVAEPVGAAAQATGITALIREFITVEAQLAEAEALVKSLKARKAIIDGEVQELMISEGMDAPPGVDGMTAYLTPVYYTERKLNPETGEPYSPEEIREALRASGLKAMLAESYNGNQLRSLLREFAENRQDPPEALATVVGLAVKRELRITPMGAAKRRAAPRPK